MRDIQLPYGIKDDKLVHISEVESGLVCKCNCPSCHAELIAKKGPDTIYHFAHHSAESCEHALETVLHLAAKDILTATDQIFLPEVIVEFSSGFRKIELAESKAYQIDSVLVEKKIGNIIPDLILDIDGHQLLVEVFVTHGVDEEKLRRIRELGISAIEIDLSSVPRDLPMRVLSDLIVSGLENKKWLNNERVNSTYSELMLKAALIKIEKLTDKRLNPYDVSYVRGVNRCPEMMRRVEKNDSSIGVEAEFCCYCKYCLVIEPKSAGPAIMESIYCVGHNPAALGGYKLCPPYYLYGAKMLGDWSSY